MSYHIWQNFPYLFHKSHLHQAFLLQFSTSLPSDQRLAAGEYRFSIALGTWTKKEPQGLYKLEGGHTHSRTLSLSLYIYVYWFNLINALINPRIWYHGMWNEMIYYHAMMYILNVDMRYVLWVFHSCLPPQMLRHHLDIKSQVANKFACNGVGPWWPDPIKAYKKKIYIYIYTTCWMTV